MFYFTSRLDIFATVFTYSFPFYADKIHKCHGSIARFSKFQITRAFNRAYMYMLHFLRQYTI